MSRALHLALAAYTLLLPARALFGQDLATPGKLVLKSGNIVKLQVAQTICSAHAHKNDRLEFVVVGDVMAGELPVIRAGSLAIGTVIEVRRRRPLGLGGHIVVALDSVELSSGKEVGLTARREFKGKSHTIRMAIGMAITAAIYLPAAPIFLLSRGRDSTILKGTEITAFTKDDTSLDPEDFPPIKNRGSELSEMIDFLPPRVLNGEGREGDMLNLIFLAGEDELQGVFARAGWLKVEQSPPKIFWHLLWQRTHYTKLPMDKLYVFGRAQDYSYALPDPQSVVARRHHLRIWKTNHDVDGVPLWVAAATHDVAIDFVKSKFRLLHRIDPNVDAEREFIAGNLAETRELSREEYVHGTNPVFAAQTATGQPYYSDSRLLLLEFNRGAITTAAKTEIAAKSR
jgi:LssY C-terminus